MRYNVLNNSEEIACVELENHKRKCIAICAITIIANVLLTLFTVEATTKLFLIINILVDIVVGMYVYTYYLANISTQKKLIAISQKAREKVSGTVEKISDETITHLSIECVEVKVSERILFMPLNTIQLSCGENIVAYCNSNVIVEVEKC